MSKGRGMVAKKKKKNGIVMVPALSFRGSTRNHIPEGRLIQAIQTLQTGKISNSKVADKVTLV